MAAFFTTGTWVAGQLTRDLKDLGSRSESPAFEIATSLLHRVLPDFEGLNLAVEAAHLLPITPADVCFPLAYGAAYSTVVLLCAILVFERRDFR